MAVQMCARETRPGPDGLLVELADYVMRETVGGESAYRHARYCLMDALGCALQALAVPDCTKLLGPVVPGTIVPNGARVPGTPYTLDPVAAAFNIGCLMRWLDFNDTWWAGGHPSDNCAGILAVADHLSRKQVAAGGSPLVMRDVLTAMIKAYEIHGVLAEGNAPNKPGIGLDLVILLKIASTAVITQLMGGTRDEVVDALSNAFIDGHSLNLYRHMPHSGPRKSWASADATSRAVRIAMMTLQGEMGYPTALTAPIWGFNDVLYGGAGLVVASSFGSRVIENVQYKIAYPAQRHSQTAAECAVRLHPAVSGRLDAIERVELHTHGYARKINVTGSLPNFAARDHCLQYVVAVGMIYGDITTTSYTDAFAADSRIDALREKMAVHIVPQYTADYEDEAKRTNSNAVQVFFRDGTCTPKIEVHYLIGDARRREEGIPKLEVKFRAAIRSALSERQQVELIDLFSDARRFEATPVHAFMDALAA
jgi:2-methylcitrate dehydratase